MCVSLCMCTLIFGMATVFAIRPVWLCCGRSGFLTDAVGDHFVGTLREMFQLQYKCVSVLCLLCIILSLPSLEEEGAFCCHWGGE